MKHILVALAVCLLPLAVGCGDSGGSAVVAEPGDYDAYLTPSGAAEDAIKASSAAGKK